MKKITKVALAFLFVTNFTLFLGWIPIGVLIPQALFFLYVILTQPKVLGSKALVFYYLFFAFQFISGLLGGNGYDITVWVAKFFVLAIPLSISTVIFSPKIVKDVSDVSIFAIVVSFTTMILSIRILNSDSNALRLCSMANSTGDWAVLYSYWKQGMANYDMAAMMLFMPVAFIYQLKLNQKWNKRLSLWAGIITTFVFMYLGQVTTTFLLCIIVTLMSVMNFKNRTMAFVGIGLMALLVFIQFTDLMEYVVSLTGGSAMNERFVAISGVAKGESLEETSDASIRWTLINTTLSSFLSHPLFGSPNALNGGHNYFLDLLAKYGIIGCLPFFLMIRRQCKVIFAYLSDESKRYYLIILLGFITLGLMKNMSGAEYWNYLFIYYPAILIWSDSMRAKKIKL